MDYKKKYLKYKLKYLTAKNLYGGMEEGEAMIETPLRNKEHEEVAEKLQIHQVR